jgi:transcriptional regulator with XRE-family HTH domain
MNIQENISSNLKKYRREIGLSQEALAERLGVTSQAVSKWECMQSIPDIEAIVALCELLGITTDKLLLDRDPEVVYHSVETETEPTQVNVCDTLPDDGVLRVLQFKGKKQLRVDELDGEVYIPLCGAECAHGIYIEGNAKFEGDIGGDVSCGNVERIVSCEGDISCGNIFTVEMCEGDISCGNVVTIETCEGDISCGNVQSINACEGDISCGDVGQIGSCEGDIDCGDVDVIINCKGDINCANVNIIQNCEGDICTE